MVAFDLYFKNTLFYAMMFAIKLSQYREASLKSRKNVEKPDYPARFQHSGLLYSGNKLLL
jgi:hypothetical protein